MQNIIIRETLGGYDTVCTFLYEKLGFQIHTLLKEPSVRHHSKKEWIAQGFKTILPTLKALPKLRHADKIFMIGQCNPLIIMFLNRLHIIHPKNLYWWAFQIHGKKPMCVLEKILRLLHSGNVEYLVVSSYEKDLYGSFFRVPSDSFKSVPYGDWDQYGLDKPAEQERAELFDGTPYFFAGGSTNRDFKALLNAWKNIKEPLLIIGSRINQDLIQYEKGRCLPNVKIMYDTDSSTFDYYMRNARACVFPFKADTGASGQTVALKAMRMHKLMISMNIASMSEYIINRETGILLDDMKQLPEAIKGVYDSETANEMVRRQNELFEKNFSYEIITRALKETINGKAGSHI